MRRVFLAIGLSLIASVASAQLHEPTWKLISDQSMSSFDMLTTRSGLLGIDANGIRILSKYTNGAIEGRFSVSGEISSIIIRDADIAYFSVLGEGIYEASNSWNNFTLLAASPNPNLLAVFGTGLLANMGGRLNFSSDGVIFLLASGIASTDTVTAAEFFGVQTAVAVTGKKIYRSLDGGRHWYVVLDTLRKTNSIYVDHTHKSIFVGGQNCLKSLDSGASWQTLSSVPFPFLTGPVFGVRDCSGTFYIGPDGFTHGTDIYRSIDQGRFFQQAGPAMFSSIRMIKSVVLDRGSTIFWLDSSGLLGCVRDGIDSVITDSVRDRILVQPDSGIRNSLCPNAAATPFNITLMFDQCTGIVLDSLKQVSSSPSFTTAFRPAFLGDTTMQIPFSYRASHTGWDTAHYRLRFHSLITGNIEQKFFSIAAFGAPGSPELNFSPPQMDFPQVLLDSAT
ncbi:MAG: hypothetical protein Q8896_10100, partial [Bacteroidota bacterium]|nr:hypothetical protein [Bacteroidota bacterium]